MSLTSRPVLVVLLAPVGLGAATLALFPTRSESDATRIATAFARGVAVVPALVAGAFGLIHTGSLRELAQRRRTRGEAGTARIQYRYRAGATRHSASCSPDWLIAQPLPLPFPLAASAVLARMVESRQVLKRDSRQSQSACS